MGPLAAYDSRALHDGVAVRLNTDRAAGELAANRAGAGCDLIAGVFFLGQERGDADLIRRRREGSGGIGNRDYCHQASG